MDVIPPEVPGHRLTSLLGHGSTATVWRARRAADDALVAVKVVPGEADEEALREYALLQHAVSDHVVTLHETLAIDTDEGPATALVLEHLAGGSLGQVVAQRGHLSPGETVTVLAPIAQALGSLHDLGVVHGDLSPGNVLLDSTGRPVIADLGYSRLTGEPPGEVHGTDGYVAPEVLDGEEPARASDVHALGALAWLCLTGAPPGHVAIRDDLSSVAPETPELVAVIESCLRTDPTARPEAGAVARAAFDAVPPEPLRMVSPGDVASGLTRRIRESAALEAPEWQRELLAAEPPSSRRRWWQRRPRTKGEARRAPSGRHGSGTVTWRPRREVSEPTGAPGAVTSEPLAQAPRTPSREIARDAATRPGPGRGAVLTATVLGLVLAVLVPWQLASAGDTRDGPERPAASASGTGGAEPSEGRRAGATQSLRHDRQAPQADPTGLARELTSLRQRMVLDLDAAVLEQLDEPGSPAAEQDRDLVDQLTASGHRYDGVDLSVRSAHTERSSGEVVVLRATTDAAAYTVTGPDGEREERAAEHGQQVDLVLVWHEEAWRVREVR